MKVTPDQDRFFHNKLPIDSDETILGIYRHHPVAYIIPLLLALIVIGVVVGLALALTTTPPDSTAIIDAAYRSYVIMGVGIFSLLVLVFTYIPVWTKMQDQLVLTNESLIQILQTSLFSDKVSQLGLQSFADVTVRSGFWGNLFGFGHITVETPGEQDNFEYGYLPNANEAARQITEAHENFVAALEAGHLHTEPMPGPGSMHPSWNSPDNSHDAPVIVVDPAEYQKFLEYQKRQKEQGPPPTNR